MSNKYGIKSQNGTPSQETIDGWLNWLDNNPPDGLDEAIANAPKESLEKQKKRLEAMSDEAQKKFDDWMGASKDSLNKKLEKMTPLLTPPTDIATTIAWIENLMSFMGISQETIDAATNGIAWWGEFAGASSSAISGMVSRTTKVITGIEKALANIESGLVDAAGGLAGSDGETKESSPSEDAKS